MWKLRSWRRTGWDLTQVRCRSKTRRPEGGEGCEAAVGKMDILQVSGLSPPEVATANQLSPSELHPSSVSLTPNQHLQHLPCSCIFSVPPLTMASTSQSDLCNFLLTPDKVCSSDSWNLILVPPQEELILETSRSASCLCLSASASKPVNINTFYSFPLLFSGCSLNTHHT